MCKPILVFHFGPNRFGFKLSTFDLDQAEQKTRIGQYPVVSESIRQYPAVYGSIGQYLAVSVSIRQYLAVSCSMVGWWGISKIKITQPS